MKWVSNTAGSFSPSVSCQIINTEEEIAREDELELEDLRKQGIAPLPKPPPGVGLLPTPGQLSPTDGPAGKKIPSLFEIKVQPTVNLAQKIAQRYQLKCKSNFKENAELILNCKLLCCFSGSTYPQNQGEGTSQFSGGSEDTQGVSMVPSGPSAPPVPPSVSPVPMSLPTGPPGPQSTSGQHPPHGFSMQPPVPAFQGNQANIGPQMNMQRPTFPPGPDLEMLQSLLSCQSLGQNPVDLLSSLLQTQTAGQQGQDIYPLCNCCCFFMFLKLKNDFFLNYIFDSKDPWQAFMQNLQQQLGTESQLQSLPPAVQKAIFLHLTQQPQKQQSTSQGNDPQRAESQDDNSNRGTAAL